MKANIEPPRSINMAGDRMIIEEEWLEERGLTLKIIVRRVLT